ncbi:proton-conducting transporter transmembrane domain-containing protein, partial [Escherichia sp. TWPC-MK]
NEQCESEEHVTHTGHDERFHCRCAILLIGFYYTDPKNGAAAMKAFVVTRVGDVFLAFALFILYNELGTLNFREMVELAPAHFADG